MKTKFQAGEKALLGKKEVEIEVAVKHFPSRTMQYKLVTGEKVAEKDLSKLKGGTKHIPQDDPKVVAIRDKYEKLYSKAVATSKKNDVEWMLKKIAEKEAINAKLGEDEVTKTPWELLLAIEEDKLSAFIEEKELGIDPADYDEIADLQVAIAEELEIEIPE